MNPLFYSEFLRRSKEYNKQKLLAVVNPEKLKALAYLLYIHIQRGFFLRPFFSVAAIKFWSSATRFSRSTSSESSSAIAISTAAAASRIASAC